jgi:hypothetical protein
LKFEGKWGGKVEEIVSENQGILGEKLEEEESKKKNLKLQII